MPRGVAGNAPPSGTEDGRAARALEMRRMAAVEALPVYAEMCAEHDRKVMDAGGKVADHGWGEYGACGDPRKKRTAAS
jgi:hypothetical protein